MLRLSLAAAFVLSLLLPAAAKPTVVIKPIKQSTKTYVVSVQVPQIVNPTPAQRAINSQLMKETEKEIAGFKKMTRDAPPQPGQKYDLSLNAKTEYLSDRWLATSVVGGEYLGGAHPSPILGTYVFDLKTGRELKLKDLFRKGSPYLQTLSTICKKHLEGIADLNSDAPWIARGTAPKAENYVAYLIDGKSLRIMFPAYQVAPYSSGPQEVDIPYADLKAVADPAGPLGGH